MKMYSFTPRTAAIPLLKSLRVVDQGKKTEVAGPGTPPCWERPAPNQTTAVPFHLPSEPEKKISRSVSETSLTDQEVSKDRLCDSVGLIVDIYLTTTFIRRIKQLFTSNNNHNSRPYPREKLPARQIPSQGWPISAPLKNLPRQF